MMTSKAFEQAYHCADETLLALISQKDMDAFEILYDRHAYTVFNLLLRITRDAGIAEELLQDTFWQIWQKVEQLESGDSAAALLLRMARHKAVDHLRRTLLSEG